MHSRTCRGGRYGNDGHPQWREEINHGRRTGRFPAGCGHRFPGLEVRLFDGAFTPTASPHPHHSTHLSRGRTATGGVRRRVPAVPPRAVHGTSIGGLIVVTRVHMPVLRGATEWLNSAPLDRADVRGSVVLFDFWTLTCINWLRTAPYIRAWSKAYRNDGLIVIGVHTPEFGFEHEVDLVRRATKERGIDYPVVVDNDYRIWSAFDNHYWPALYFVDRDGIIRDEHFGEGRYEESERRIQRLLGVDRPLSSVEAVGVEAAADWAQLRAPETYLGYRRSSRSALSDGAAVDASRAYVLPSKLRLNQWGLGGQWTVGAESVVLDRPGGSIAHRFHARDAHVVLSSSSREPIPFRVLLDGNAPGSSHGVDVEAAGDGVLKEGRMYQLVRQQGPVHDRTIEIQFLEKHAEAYAFTFG
jgi:thiol-disulfide isomerase/thioredoxin